MANSVQVLINGTDFQKYVSGPITKTDNYSDPNLLDFTLIDIKDGVFTKPTRGQYVSISTSTYGTWFTGYITNEPQLTYMGSSKVGGVSTPMFGYTYQATSDEYILNIKPIGIVPPFINTNHGTILKYLVTTLAPGVTFDVTNIGNGLNVARYVVDPNKHFSEVVKEFCDAANYRFSAKNKALTFQQADAVGATIAVDGSSKHFTPNQLSVNPSSDPVVNDVIVLGDVEPQNYITEYFIGDNATAKFDLMSSVYGVDRNILLDDDFSSEIDTSKWSVFDTANNWLQVSNGYLNCLGGSANNALDVYLQSANLVPLEGNLRLTHGEWDFLPTGNAGVSGIIGGLWNVQTPAMTDNQTFTGCMYGLRLFKQNNLVPDSDLLNAATTWTNVTGVTVRTGGGAVRGNSWQYTGNGTASGFLFPRSGVITVTPGARYTLSAYVDASKVTAGNPMVGVYKPDISTGYLTMTQNPGVNSRITASITIPAGVTQVVVIADTNNATVTNGQLLQFSNIQFELASAATVYESTAATATTDTNSYLMPIVGNALDRTQPITINTSKRYVLRTIVSTQQLYRYTTGFSAISQSGVVTQFNGVAPADTLKFTTLVSEIDPTTGLLSNQWTLSNTSTLSNSFAYYNALVANDLHCSFTGVTLSMPMQVSLDIKKSGTTTWVSQLVGPNEMDALDNQSPVATIADSGSGTTTKSSQLGISKYNPGNAALTFFKNSTSQTTTIPSVGDLIRLRYRRAGAAIARVQNIASIATESAAWGDNGIRSTTRRDLSPLPRTSVECEQAAAALATDAGFQHYSGSYKMPSGTWFSGEPASGTILKFQNLPSGFPAALQAEQIQVVKTSLVHMNGGEHFEHEIQYGAQNTINSVLATIQSTNDVFTPQDAVEIPQYINAAAVGTVFAPDVIAPELVSWDTNNLIFDTKQSLPVSANLLLQSANLSVSPWLVDTTAGSTVTGGVTDFNGSTSAATLTRGSGAGGTWATLYQLIQGGFNAAGKTFTVSFWLQALSGTQAVSIGVSDYTTTTKSVSVTATTTWQRFSATFSGFNNTGFISAGVTLFTAATQVNVCGAQLEIGTAVSPWINTGTTNPTIGGFEVRYSDDTWGCDPGKNLISRFTTGTVVTVPRTARGKVCFIKQYDFRNKVQYSEDATKWTAYSNVSSLTNVSMPNPDGDVSFVGKAVYTAAGTGVGIPHTNFACALATVNGSVWVKGTAGQQASLLLDSSNGSVCGSATITLNGGWQFMNATGTWGSIATGTGLLLVQLNGAGTLYITRASTEVGTAPTVYCKTNGNPYGATSRYAAGLAVHFPLQPQAPTGSVNLTDPVNPLVTLNVPTVASDVWGVEVRRAQNYFTNTTTYAGWANQSTTITSGQTDPLSGTTAALLTNNGTVVTDPYINQRFVGVGALGGRTFTFQAQVKGTGATIGKSCTLFMFDDPLASVFTQSIVLTANWQTVTMTRTFPTTISNANLNARVDFVNDTPALNDQVYVYGCQLEESPFATPYNATNGTSLAAYPSTGLMYHSDLTNASYVNVIKDVNNTIRSLVYYLYCYNILGEYGPFAKVTTTIATPTASALAVDSYLGVLSWTGANALGYVVTSTLTLPDGTTNTIHKTVLTPSAVLSDVEFLCNTQYVVTPYDALGNGSASTPLTFQYTPTGLAEFNANEVFVVNTPTSTLADPVVPTKVGDFTPDYIGAAWQTLGRNKLIRT